MIWVSVANMLTHLSCSLWKDRATSNLGINCFAWAGDVTWNRAQQNLVTDGWNNLYMMFKRSVNPFFPGSWFCQMVCVVYHQNQRNVPIGINRLCYLGGALRYTAQVALPRQFSVRNFNTPLSVVLESLMTIRQQTKLIKTLNLTRFYTDESSLPTSSSHVCGGSLLVWMGSI